MKPYLKISGKLGEESGCRPYQVKKIKILLWGDPENVAFLTCHR
jgi:tryptophan 2,3-dioxygenase